MKKIFFISTNSDEAGAPRHCELLIEEARKKYDVFFITGEAGAVYKRLIDGGVNCILIPNLRNEITPIKDILVFFALLKLIRKFKPDLLHLHSAKAGLLGRMCGYFFKIPTVYTVHGFGWRGMSSLKKLLILNVEKIFAKIPDINYILVSHEQVSDATQRLKIPLKNVDVIHNGVVDIEPSLIKSHSISKTITLIMVARVCAAKDHITLLKAFKKLEGSVKLVLCGHGTDSKDFVSLANQIVGTSLISNIKFLGERNDIDRILPTADVLVLSSHFEALPISIIEGMRAGLPIVASDVGGVAELISPDCGFLFKPGDDDELLKSLKILTCVEKRMELGSAARLRYQKQFSGEFMMQRVDAKYKELLTD